MTDKPAPLSDRTFGLSFAVVFLVIEAVAWFVFDVLLTWPFYASAAFAGIALAAPTVLLPLNRLWMRLAMGLGHVNNHLILGIVFYGLIAPIGLGMRLFGRDPMARKITPAAATYFTPVGRQVTAETLNDTF